MLKKLTSRKLWIAVAGIAVGLSAMFGIDGQSIETVAGAVVSIASVLGYIITEGRVDAAREMQAETFNSTTNYNGITPTEAHGLFSTAEQEDDPHESQ